jgi:hypothetical protein
VRQRGEELILHAVDTFGFAPRVLFAAQQLRALGFCASALGNDGPQPLVRLRELVRPLADPQLELVMGTSKIFGLELERS